MLTTTLRESCEDATLISMTNHTITSKTDGRPGPMGTDATIMKQQRVGRVVVHMECQGEYGVDRVYSVSIMRMGERRIWTYAGLSTHDDIDDGFNAFAAKVELVRFIQEL